MAVRAFSSYSLRRPVLDSLIPQAYGGARSSSSDHSLVIEWLQALSPQCKYMEMDEESNHHASMPGNLILETEKWRLLATEEDEARRMTLDVYQIDVPWPVWMAIKAITYALLAIPSSLIKSIIYPDSSIYFLQSSFISVSVDPLFLYIPLINEQTKCLMFDRRLMITALILRMVVDLRYIARIGSKINKRLQGSATKIAMSIALDIAAILPIPHVVVLVFLPNMRGSRALYIMKILNSLMLLQYLQRTYPIYRFCKNLNKYILEKSTAHTVKDRVSSLVNFLMYTIAGYVLGTFWYFFSVQRELDCWGYACQNEKGCEFSTRCDANTVKNITLINNSCPINPANATVFDFGIFLYALQSGMQESTNFPQKFLQCFSWGVRNLSSFASNLNTSTYEWETLFVVAISLSGLLLFIYFLGHMQTFMQATGRSGRAKLKWETILKPKIQSMLFEYSLPHDLGACIEYVVQKEHLEDPDIVVENMCSIFSFSHKVDDKHLPSKAAALNRIRNSLFLNKLKKVPKLEDRDENVLKEICKHLNPVMYPKGSYIIQEGEPLDMMFFITQGTILTYTTNNHGGRNTGGFSTTIRLEKWDYFGEELLSWAETSTSFSDLPNADRTVKCHKKVELFAIQAADLQSVVSRLSSQYFSTELPSTADSTDHMEIYSS